MHFPRLFFSTIVSAILVAFGSKSAFGQCTGCDYVFSDATGGPAIPNNTTSKLICVTAANRTAAINLNNTQNATVCVAENTIMSAAFSNMHASTIVNNYGQIGTSGTPRNLTVGTNGGFNNYGTFFGNFTSNNGASINNTGTITGNVTLNSGAAVYTNSGTQTGSLTANSGTSVVNTGALNLTGLTSNSGSSISNSREGSISVSASVSVNGSVSNEGEFSVTGNLTVNGSATLTNSGDIDLSGNFTNNGTTNSPNGTMDVGGNLTNNGGSVLNIGAGTVGGNATNNGTINISGSLQIDGNLTANGGSNISSADDDQANYLYVGGNFTAWGCLNGNNGMLFVNKYPTTGGTCQNGEIYQGTGSGCMDMVELPIYINGGHEYIERVYVFNCSTGWLIPGPNQGEEIVDEAEVLIVGGGGGGGFGLSAGGGGAGAVLYIPSLDLPFGTIVPITIGLGGRGATNSAIRGWSGEGSEFLSNSALGGGGGASTNLAVNGGNAGGSGGGGAYQNSGGGGAGNAGQGHAGGNGRNSAGSTRQGGGGGGAGGAGSAGTNAGAGQSNGGAGGIGLSVGIRGSSEFFAAGGGGSATGGAGGNSPGTGGSGIGGNGNNGGVGGAGAGNTGSGGGAGSTGGGAGGSGIVIVRQQFRILPVEFLFFEANFRREKREIILRWATGKEWNNSHFEIERSYGSKSDWAKIGVVNGTGWSDSKTEYEFSDKNPPLAGGLVYFRLRQVDYDGKFAISKVVSVRVPQLLETKGTWVIYPNPVTGSQVNLEALDHSLYQGEEVMVKVIHPSGQVQQAKSLDLVTLSAWMGEVFSKSQKGLFVVEVSWGKYREYQKVLSRP